MGQLESAIYQSLEKRRGIDIQEQQVIKSDIFAHHPCVVSLITLVHALRNVVAFINYYLCKDHIIEYKINELLSKPQKILPTILHRKGSGHILT